VLTTRVINAETSSGSRIRKHGPLFASRSPPRFTLPLFRKKNEL
jgi:hypothetical protein